MLRTFYHFEALRPQFGFILLTDSIHLRIIAATAPLLRRIGIICTLRVLLIHCIMSKRSLFWGQAAGKLGEAVYYRAGGEQRTRTYVAKIKNPKSYMQALQRTKFNNMVAVFRGTSIFVKSFFRPEKTNQSAFNAFVKHNFPLCVTVADKEMCEYGEGCSEDFVFANGSINFNTTPSVVVGKNLGDAESDTTFYWGLTIQASDVEFSHEVQSDVVGLYTGAELYQALVGKNNPYNLPAQFSLSFIECIQGNVAPAYYVYTVNCSAKSTDTLRCIQFPRGAQPPTVTSLMSKITPLGGVYTPETGATHAKIKGLTTLAFGTGYSTVNSMESGIAVCLSYRDSAGLQTTTSVMMYGEELQSQANNYLPTEEAGRSIVDSYQIVSSNIGE